MQPKHSRLLQVMRPTRSALGGSQAFLVGLLFFLFLSFPFFFRNINTGIYSALKYLLIMLTFLYVFYSNAPLKGLTSVKAMVSGRLWALTFVSGYSGYFVALLVVSIYTASSQSETEDVMKALAYKLQILVLAILFALALDIRTIQRICAYYVNFMAFMGVMGLLTVYLIFTHSIQPIGSIDLDNGTSRDLYLFGLVWPDTWLGSGYGLMRLQSFSDEAGTFAFALIPAILLALNAKKFWHAGLMIVCLVLTFSVGGYLALISALILLGTKKSGWRIGLGALAVVAAVSIAIPVLSGSGKLDKLSYLADKYLSSKYNSDTDSTSLGSRSQDFEATLVTIEQNPYGLGTGAAQTLGISLAVGWVVPLLEAGILGWLLYVMAFLALLYRALTVAIFSDGLPAVLGCTLLVLAFAAIQRGGMDSTIWHWWWLIAFLRLEADGSIAKPAQARRRASSQSAVSKTSSGITPGTAR